jgi:hypothetical protein
MKGDFRNRSCSQEFYLRFLWREFSISEFVFLGNSFFLESGDPYFLITFKSNGNAILE